MAPIPEGTSTCNSAAVRIGRSCKVYPLQSEATARVVAPPWSAFWTMGAVMRLRGKIPNRNALVDLGAGGALAALLIAVPMLFVGVSLSSVDVSPLD